MESIISFHDKKFNTKRTNLFLKSTGCVNGGNCIFCEYWKNSDTYSECIDFNKHVIDQIPNNKGIIEIAPSASIFELPQENINYFFITLSMMQYELFVTECHWYYRNLVSNFKNYFDFIPTRMKIGIETFNNTLRAKLGKNFIITVSEFLKYNDSATMLVGVVHQTINDVLEDIKICSENLAYSEFTLIDTNNKDLIDQNVYDWFIEEGRFIADQHPNIKVWLDVKEYATDKKGEVDETL